MTSNGRRRRFALPVFLSCSLAVSLTACSGSARHGPALARADSAPLVALAQRISTEGACAQRRDIHTLQQRAVALFNRRRVPGELQDPLMSGVNALAEDAPPCVPAVPAQTTPTPPPPAPPSRPHPHGHGHEKPEKHDKHDKHGKHH
jgi:hypothetical protein